MEDKDEKSSLFGEISIKIKQYIAKYDDIASNKLEWKLLKRTQQFTVGDFSLLICKFDQEKHCQVIQKLATLLKEESQSWRVPIKECDVAIKEGKLHIKLDHTAVFKQGIQEVLAGDEEYGKCAMDQICNVMINCHEMFEAESDVSLDLIRSLLLAQHTMRLLQANGYNTNVNSTSVENDETCQILDKYQLNQLHLDVSAKEKSSVSCDSLFENLKSSRHRLSENDARLLNRQNRNKDVPMQVLYFDLHTFLEENPEDIDHLDYCPSINIAEVSCDCSRMNELTMLESQRRDCDEKGAIDECVHVVCADHEFSQQQLDLVWRLTQDSPTAVRQTHLVHGLVTAIGGQGLFLPDAEEFFRMRHEFTQKSTVEKYGEAALGESWMGFIDGLTAAAIKFEMLSKTCRGDVKLDVNAGGSTSRMGSFVLYNYARLCALFEHFQEKVDQGVYSPLPNVDDIDFTLLREEEEWMLFYNYVLIYPSLVRSTVSDHVVCDGHTAKIHTHKVCTFLSYLSKDFSSYYNRVHVLGESRKHLQPLMFARLYLLKTIQLVMSNALALLDIEPLRQM